VRARGLRPSRRWLRWAERVVILALLLFVASRLWPQLSAWTGIGPRLGPAPEIRVTTLDGRSFGPEELRGRVVLVNFWATWCIPCRVEMPALQRLHERYAAEGLVVLGLSTDSEGRALVERYLEENGFTFPVAMADPETRRAFGEFRAIPTTFLIDRDGTIRHRVTGIFAPPALRSAVERLLEDG